MAARITADVLVAHGEADAITPIGQAEAFADAMRAAGHPIDLFTYGSPAGHSLPWDVVTSFDEPDELLRDRFLDDTAAWLAEHTGARDR